MIKINKIIIEVSRLSVLSLVIAFVLLAYTDILGMTIKCIILRPLQILDPDLDPFLAKLDRNLVYFLTWI